MSLCGLGQLGFLSRQSIKGLNGIKMSLGLSGFCCKSFQPRNARNPCSIQQKMVTFAGWHSVMFGGKLAVCRSFEAELSQSVSFEGEIQLILYFTSALIVLSHNDRGVG